MTAALTQPNDHNSEEIGVAQKQNLKKVFISYTAWVLGNSMLAVAASVAASYTNFLYPLTESWIRVLQVGSVVLEAAAIGQPGWDIQTWSGDSLAEKWDNILNKLFLSIGLFFIVFSFQLDVEHVPNFEDLRLYIESIQKYPLPLFLEYF